jgi:thioredoxin reductase (NADPH)
MPALFNYKKAIVESNNEVINWVSTSEFKERLILKKNTGVKSVSKVDSLFKIIDSNNEEYFAKYLILCTGVMDVQPKINGSIKAIFPYANVQLVDYCIRCDGHHTLHKRLGLIGHNSSTLWIAAMMKERYGCPEITIFLNGENSSFDDEAKTLISKYNLKIVHESITELLGDPKAPILKKIKTENKEFDVDIIFISLGMIVYNQLAISLGAEVDERGFVTTDTKGKSSIDGLYIAGDLRANTKKQIYTAWDTAVDSADEVNLLIRRSKRNQNK